LEGWLASGGEPVFRHAPDYVSKEFVFVHGPSFGHTGVINAGCAYGMTLALRRLTSTRKPGEMYGGTTLHQHLIDRQYSMMQENPCLGVYIHEMRARMRFSVDAPRERELLWAFAAHKKKMLRILAEITMEQEGGLLDKTRVRNNRTKGKFKKGEINKCDGWPRMIVDLTVEGSTVAGFLIDAAKDSMAVEYANGVFSSRFVQTPTSEDLIESFHSVLNGPPVVHRYFSDDSIVGVDCVDGRLFANIDISSADLSYYDPIFDMVESILRADSSTDHEVDSLMRQLELPVVVHNPEDPSERVTLTAQPFNGGKGRYLSSGIVLTTLTNNVGNSSGMLIFQSRWHRQLTRAQAVEMLVSSYRDAGMLITVEVCQRVEDLQFLKHSPTYVGGECRVFLNLGVFMKGFGTYFGELPRTRSGERDWASRAREFNSDVVRSYVHAGDHCITRAFRTKIVGGMAPTVELRGCGGYDIPTLSLCSRYDVEEHEMEELAHMIYCADIGDRIFHTVVDKVMSKDYGFQPLAEYSPLVPSSSTTYLPL